MEIVRVGFLNEFCEALTEGSTEDSYTCEEHTEIFVFNILRGGFGRGLGEGRRASPFEDKFLSSIRSVIMC